MIYLILFYEFFKTGLFSIGGGLATLPFLYDIADRYDFFTRDDIADMIAISESTPGAIGINCATYAGFTAGRLLGAVIATTALVLPSLIITIIIAKFLQKFSENKVVKSAFYGIRPIVTALIASAFFEVLKISVITLEKFYESNNFLEIVSVPNLLLFAILFALIMKFKKHPVIYIATAAIVGVVFSL